MRWTLKPVTELDSGQTKVHDVAHWERADMFINPVDLGMTIEENKQIAASIQTRMVSDQGDQPNKALTACRFCGGRVRTKGYYRSAFKAVFGKVPMQVRRVWGCECRGAGTLTFSSLPTGKNPTSPELKYLTSKLAAVMPFWIVADFLGELLPDSATPNTNPVRNRLVHVGCHLEKAAANTRLPQPDTPAPEILVGLDGGDV